MKKFWNNTNMIAPSAKKGPKGIFTSRVCFNTIIVPIPKRAPSWLAIIRVIQQPKIPTNEPMKAISSKSPWPIPSLPDAHKKNWATLYKIRYPKIVPVTLGRMLMGKRPVRLQSQPTGISASVI